MIDFIDILLVEDNAYEAELAIRAFKKRTMANCIVHVKDGQEAMDFLYGTGTYEGRDVSNVPRIILLDLNLPKIGGLEVLLKIRSNENTRMVPVVVLTASSEERDMVASYRLGANSYVVKPHDFEKFLEVTSNLITYWLLINQLPQLKPRK
jgi:DNA-binding response OmpR family regulator